ncbi:MAG: mechanosensitive ion channel family protein [Acidobacteria bacterium]|nr:mechanosensitive ion channel family protein [Acidobacteriota bacterium]
MPLKQWEVGRELRRRIKKTFDAQRIEIPFPHVSVYFGEASAPFAVRQAGGPGVESVLA